MRTLTLALFLLAAPSVVAQRAADVPGRPAPVALSETPGGLGLGNLFNAQTLDLSHSLEMSYGAGAAGSVGLGMYTSTLRWQPSAWLAGRVDVAVAQTLGASGLYAGLGQAQPQVFLRNAELAIRPTENAQIHFRVSQSPYGAYASPYGRYGRSPYGIGGLAGRAALGSSTGDLFFRDGQ